jgi:hypothetical protein
VQDSTKYLSRKEKMRKRGCVNLKMVPAFSASSKKIGRIEMCSDEQNCYNNKTFWRIIVICDEIWGSLNSNEKQNVEVLGVFRD